MEFGKFFIILGIILVVIGIILQFGPPLNQIPLGRLPGDIRVEREGFSFYFPLTSSLLVSALLSVVLWLLRR